jgi:hypothetical protein
MVDAMHVAEVEQILDTEDGRVARRSPVPPWLIAFCLPKLSSVSREGARPNCGSLLFQKTSVKIAP